MSFSFDDRVLALAGIAQALQQVRRIAETGHSEAAIVRTAMDSVMRIDAPTPEAVYGSARQVEPGLRLLRDYFRNQGKDQLLPRLALSVMQLERRFVREATTLDKVDTGIRATSARLAELGESNHPDVLAAMAELYKNSISQLKPKIMVQGNPHYLNQATVVAEIRALLLAAVRSAVLWRQLGGNYWDFLFSRKAMVEAIQRHLR